MGSIKEINIKDCTYYLFDDMIKIKDFIPNFLKIDKNSYKNIDIHYIGCITMKNFDYVNIDRVNPLYLIIDKADGYIEESNRNKCLTLVSTDKSQKILTKYAEVWNEIKILIKKINGKRGDYDQKYI